MTTTISGSNGIVFPDATSMQTGQQAVKAWVNFNGEGTVAIRAGYNVGSITDNGTGDYTVNFTTAMVDVNYTPVMSGGHGASQNHYLYPCVSNVSAPTTSSFRIYSAWPFSPWQGDSKYVTVAILR